MEKTDSPTQHSCLNCGQPLADDAKFCSNCSQKSTDGRLTFGELMREFSDAVFNVDSQIFRTLAALFIPGKLTLEYFKGRHKSHVHPIRLFLVVTVALIAAISFSIKDKDINIEQWENKVEKEYERHLFLADFDTTKAKTAAYFKNPLVDAALDSLSKHLVEKRDSSYEDSLDLSQAVNLIGEKYPQIARKDYIELPMDSLLKKYRIEGFIRQMVLRQQLKFLKQGNNFIPYIIGNASWMILLMMPFLALILKLFYIRRKYFYVEHLIFSFHMHAFVFFVAILLVLFSKHLPGWVIPVAVVGLIFYLLFSMKRVYQQKWLKTILKFCLVNLMYFILFNLFIVLTFVVSFFLF